MSTTCAFLVTFLLATTASGARAAAAPRACARSGAGRATRELRACCIAADNGSGERSVSARCTGLVGLAQPQRHCSAASAAGWPLRLRATPRTCTRRVYRPTLPTRAACARRPGQAARCSSTRCRAALHPVRRRALQLRCAAVGLARVRRRAVPWSALRLRPQRIG